MKHMYKSFFLYQFMPNLPYTKSCPKRKLFSRSRSWQILPTYSTRLQAVGTFLYAKSIESASASSAWVRYRWKRLKHNVPS